MSIFIKAGNENPELKVYSEKFSLASCELTAAWRRFSTACSSSNTAALCFKGAIIKSESSRYKMALMSRTPFQLFFMAPTFSAQIDTLLSLFTNIVQEIFTYLPSVTKYFQLIVKKIS